MSVQLSISLDDLGLQERLSKLSYDTLHLQPVMRDFGERMMRSVAKNFRAGGRPDNWKKSKRAQDTGGQTLVKSSRLKNSITYQADDTSLTVGTNVIYARIHQLGGEIRPKTKKALNTPFGPRGAVRMPARPFLLFQDDDVEYLKDSIRRYLLRQ